MSNPITKKDLSILQKDLEATIDKSVSKAVSDLTEVISSFAVQVDMRFTGIESHLDKIEVRLEQHDAKFDRLLSTIDAFVARIDRYETERTARDSQFEKLVEWAHKVSKKTGIPLENL